jgi:hypothetical protein
MATPQWSVEVDSDGSYRTPHYVDMELIPDHPDRAVAESDRRHLADLSPDAPCELPTSRVRAYVHAYLNTLPPTKPAAASSPSTDAPSRLRELAVKRGPVASYQPL